jgi:hypothetical protein
MVEVVAVKYDLVEIGCEIRHETDKAFLIFDGDKEVWIPKSIGEWDQDAKTMAMPERWALDKGLI